MRQGGGSEWFWAIRFALIGLVLSSSKVAPSSSFTLGVKSPMSLSGMVGGNSVLRMAIGGDSGSVSHFDYLVIGGGSGGVSSARRAATYGAKVGLIENQGTKLGGTCVNVGCVPKKVMWNAATMNEMLHEAKHYGFRPFSTSLDWSILKEARDSYTTRLNGIYANNLKNSGITLIDGKKLLLLAANMEFLQASMMGSNCVHIEGTGEKYTADHILVAVGGKPTLPNITGVYHGITSDGFFALTSQPRKVAIVGAGYIAVELAGVFQALGTDSTVIVRGKGVVPKFDPMIGEILETEMQRSGMTLKTSTEIEAINLAPDGTKALVLKGGEKLDGFDEVLFATGREPLTADLNLKSAGILTDSTGHIMVDDYQCTSTPGVYAVGDVVDRDAKLTPMAIAAGRRLSDRLFGGMKKAKADYKDVPTVVFSHPPIGTVGLSEPQAIVQYGQDAIKVYKSKYINMYYGPWKIRPPEKPPTAVKVVCVGKDEKVVGIHCIGMAADEMLQGFGVALKMGATKADLDACVAVHPTAAEELVTLPPWGL